MRKIHQQKVRQGQQLVEKEDMRKLQVDIQKMNNKTNHSRAPLYRNITNAKYHTNANRFFNLDA